MSDSPMNKILWLRRRWGLKMNPFPATAIARLGAEDDRENGLLFNPSVQASKIREATDKFILGPIYSGLKFGFLWSIGTGSGSDARGFGKSSMLQFLVERVNQDWGRQAILDAGLDESDATEEPIAAVLAAFDMANARSLNAVFYEAARFACRFSAHADDPTVAARLRLRLISKVGSDDATVLREAVEATQQQLRGRTLGPLVSEFVDLLVSNDPDALVRYVNDVTPTKRTRSGANYLATFLVFAKAAGIRHLLLCCDQLEDFASTTTSKQKRTVEIERFRDYVLELQPMSDMLSVIVTMHPRATSAIADMWALADLPSYDYARTENGQRVVILETMKSVGQVRDLLVPYLAAFRAPSDSSSDPLYPFTEDALQAILQHTSGKPRDILRTAAALIDTGAEANWKSIGSEATEKFLASFALDDSDEMWAIPALVDVNPWAVRAGENAN
jgi:hypothetical protein